MHKPLTLLGGRDSKPRPLEDEFNNHLHVGMGDAF